MDQDRTWYRGGPWPGHIVLDGDPVSLPQKGGRAAPRNFRPISTVMPLGREGGLGPDDIVLYEDTAPPRGHSPQLSAHVYCGQTTVCIRIPFGTEVGLRLGDIVLDAGPASPPIKGHSPQFSANVRCGQTAGWTKMPLGTEVCLSPGDFVFDGDPTPLEKKGTPPPNFWPMSIVAKLLDE